MHFLGIAPASGKSIGFKVKLIDRLRLFDFTRGFPGVVSPAERIGSAAVTVLSRAAQVERGSETIHSASETIVSLRE
jgi:hypothetical protein